VENKEKRPAGIVVPGKKCIIYPEKHLDTPGFLQNQDTNEPG